MPKQNESLKDLEKRLSIALLRKAELENEIQTLSPACVQNLPFELLTEIFEAVEIVDATSLQNLRLVCSSWNQIALKTPYLWSKIHVIVPPTLQGAEQCNEHCIRHMERSRGRTLDISIHLHLHPREHDIFKQLIDVSDISSSTAIRQWIIDGVLTPALPSWISDYVEWRPKFAYMHHAHSGAKAILKHCKRSWLKPLSTLIGENGDAMTRWRSFEFMHLPPSFLWHDDLVKEVFAQGIKIHPSCEVLRVNILRRSWQLPIVLADCQRQNLQVLDLRNITPQGFDLTTINPLNIRHISLEYCDVSSLRFLLGCPNLECLGFQHYHPSLDAVGKSTVGQRDEIDELQAQILQLRPMELPNLRILEFHHYIPRYLLRLIHAPFLQTLIIYTWNVIFHIRGIPEFNFKSLFPSLKRVEFRTTQHNLKWLQLSTLRFVFSNASAIEMVMIEETQLESFLNAMLLLGNEGIRPERLEYIDVTSYWNDGQKQPTILRTIKYHESLLNTTV
jgi:hypothetical protein